jgi:2-aminoethylphosphonate dioxygenase
VSLTDEQLKAYRRDGFLLLGNVFEQEEIDAWDIESKRLLQLGLAHRDNLRTKPYYISQDVWIVDRLDPVVDISPVFEELAGDQRLRSLLHAIMGDEALLFKDRLIYKMIGMPGYPIHQDYSWWQIFPWNLVNIAISIDTADSENGALELFPGYHDRLLSAPGEMRHMNEEESRQIDFACGQIMQTKPGDVVIFDCRTPHRSGPNLSKRLRRQLYLTYSAAQDGDLYEWQLECFREGRSSRTISTDDKSRMFLR